MTWLSVKEAAALLDIQEQSVRKILYKGKYISRKVPGVGRAGMQFEVALESLPESARQRYHNEAAAQEDESADQLLALTEAQREEFFAKIAIVRSYLEFKESYPRSDKLDAFLFQYNAEHPARQISRRQLDHWQRLYDRDGINGLIDRRGGWNKGVRSIPEQVQKVFLAYWLQEKGTKNGGPSIASCYRLTQKNFPHMQLPSIEAFKRLTQTIPLPTVIYCREGEKAYKDKCEPYIIRNYASIHTNQQWVADNHVFDVLVLFPDGKVGRPWVVGWMDMSSRYIVGFHIISGTPNSDHILDAFIGAATEYGIPEKVQLDNGKDYVVHDLFNRDNVYSLANEMSLQVTNAIKYNAKAKGIERFFNTLEYSYLIHLDSYIGSNPKKRPEHLSKTNDKLTGQAIHYDEFLEYVHCCIAEYNNTPHSGHNMNSRTPSQAFTENITVPIKTTTPQMLSLYAQRRTRPLTVGRNGIKIKELDLYYDDIRLATYQGKKVFAKYRTEDIRQVYIFSEDGEFLCVAASVALGELNQEMSAQQIRQLNNKKRERRKLMKSGIPDIRVPSVQQLAIEAGNSFSKPDLKLLPSVVHIDTKKHKQAETIRKEEKRIKEKKAPARPAPLKAVAGGVDPKAVDEALRKRFLKDFEGG